MASGTVFLGALFRALRYASSNIDRGIMTKLFISHSWTDSEELSELMNFVNSHYLSFDDRSVYRHAPIPGDAPTVKSEIATRIAESAVVIFLVDHRFFASHLIRYEHEIAVKYEKSMIVVKSKQVYRLPAIFTTGDCRVLSSNYKYFWSELRGLLGDCRTL